MSKEAIVMVGYVKIDNRIDYDIDKLVNLGHIDKDGNRVEDVVISYGGTVSIKNQLALFHHEFANNHNDVYNWYVMAIGMLKCVGDNNANLKYFTSMIYVLERSMKLFSEGTIECEFKPINTIIPAINVSEREAIQIKTDKGIYGYCHLAKIDVEGAIFYILANGHILAEEPCTISYDGFLRVLEYGMNIIES